MPAADPSVSRYPQGVTNAYDNAPFANLRVPDRSIYHEWSDDFDRYLADASNWLVGGVGTPARALAGGDGGNISVVTTAALNDSSYLQTAVTGFTLVAGKKLFFKARGSVDSALNAALSFGLQIAVAANNFLTPADGLFLRKPAADTNFYLVSRVGGVETVSAALGTIADATIFDVSFAYDGAGNVVGALNGVSKASITAALTAVALKPVAGVLAGTAAARTLTLDYLYAAKER